MEEEYLKKGSSYDGDMGNVFRGKLTEEMSLTIVKEKSSPNIESHEEGEIGSYCNSENKVSDLCDGYRTIDRRWVDDRSRRGDERRVYDKNGNWRGDYRIGEEDRGRRERKRTADSIEGRRERDEDGLNGKTNKRKPPNNVIDSVNQSSFGEAHSDDKQLDFESNSSITMRSKRDAHPLMNEIDSNAVKSNHLKAHCIDGSSKTSEKRRKRRTGWNSSDELVSTAATNTLGDSPSTENINIVTDAVAADLYVQSQLCRIYVGSLDYTLNEEDIIKVFAAFGKIVCVDMPKEPAAPRSKGFCFVEYANKESADIALQSMQGFVLKGRTIKVGRPAISGSLQGLPNVGATPDVLRDSSMQSLTAGAVATAPHLQNRAGIKLDTDSLINQVGQQPSLPQGAPSAILGITNIHPPFATSPTMLKNPLTGIPPVPLAQTKVCVDNLPLAFGSNETKKIFEVFGSVTDCYMVPRSAHPSSNRGIAHVTYSMRESAEAAVNAMNNFKVADSELKVTFVDSVSDAVPCGALNNRVDEASPVIIMTNMIDVTGIDHDLPDEIRDECANYGNVKTVYIFVNPQTMEVSIFVSYETPDEAKAAQQALHLRWFGGRQIKCRQYDNTAYEAGNYTEG